MALSLLLPEPSPSAPARASAASETTRESSGWRKTLEIARRASVAPLLRVKVIGSIAASMHATAAPLVLSQQLGLDAAALGLSMSASSVAVACLGAFAMAPLVRTVGVSKLARCGLALRAACSVAVGALVALAVAQGQAALSASLVAAILASSVLHACALAARQH